MKIYYLLLIVFQFTFAQSHQESNGENLKVRQIELLQDCLSVPNNSNNHNDIEQNLEWLIKEFRNRNFEVKRLKTNDEDLLYANYTIDKSLPTVLFYMHFDGQPVDASKWNQPNPYNPVIKEKVGEEWVSVEESNLKKVNDDWRIFARSSSDDKGPIVMFLLAVENLILKKQKPSFNIKVILDSQEEKGSPNLKASVEQYKDLLKSDYFVVFDGPLHDSLKPTIIYGVRGVITLTMETFGPSKPQHSGHFGNYAPNPVFIASELLASMKDKDGRVIIKGFYDGIHLSESDLTALNNVKDFDTVIKSRAGFAKSELVGRNYQESMQYPSLNVNGILSGWVGDQSRTIVPSKCTIEMDIRTVPESNSDDLINKLKTHIQEQGFTILDHFPTMEEQLKIDKPLYFYSKALMFPFRTPIDSKIGKWIRTGITNSTNKEIVQIRISGGSVPLSFFINSLKVPTVLVPLVNPDNNQHSPNENLRLGNFFEGIQRIEGILLTPIEEN